MRNFIEKVKYFLGLESNPFVLKTTKLLCVDVDQTLVLFKWTPEMEHEVIDLYFHGIHERVWPHKHHIKMMREFKLRGIGVVVWSAGGYQWAEYVVKRLGLKVDGVMNKPDWVVDDQPILSSIGHQFYYDPLTGKDSGTLKLEVPEYVAPIGRRARRKKANGRSN